MKNRRRKPQERFWPSNIFPDVSTFSDTLTVTRPCSRWWPCPPRPQTHTVLHLAFVPGTVWCQKFEFVTFWEKKIHQQKPNRDTKRSHQQNRNGTVEPCFADFLSWSNDEHSPQQYQQASTRLESSALAWWVMESVKWRQLHGRIKALLPTNRNKGS